TGGSGRRAAAGLPGRGRTRRRRLEPAAHAPGHPRVPRLPDRRAGLRIRPAGPARPRPPPALPRRTHTPRRRGAPAPPRSAGLSGPRARGRPPGSAGAATAPPGAAARTSPPGNGGPPVAPPGRRATAPPTACPPTAGSPSTGPWPPPILTWANGVHGVPLQRTGTVSGRGLAHRSLGGSTRGPTGCPGARVVPRLAEIVKRAGGSGGGCGKASAFPLPSGYAFGAKGGPAWRVSGYYSRREDLHRRQRRVPERGWTGPGVADGLYGPKTEK